MVRVVQRRLRLGMGLIALMAIVFLGGCSEPSYPQVGPHSAADVRSAATKRVADATTVPSLSGPSGLEFVAERLRDGCGVIPSGQSLHSDYSREYRCEVGRAALYTVVADEEAGAADIVDGTLVAMGCTSPSTLSSEIPADVETNSSGAGLTTFSADYECDGVDVFVTLGEIGNESFARHLRESPVVTMNTPVVEAPPLEDSALAEASSQGTRYAVFLEGLDKYFSVMVCDGLQTCSDVWD
jgi:hypothetical protein